MMNFVIPVVVSFVFPCIVFFASRKVAGKKFDWRLCCLALLLSNVCAVAIFCLQPGRGFHIFISHVARPTYKFWGQYTVLVLPFSFLFSFVEISCIDNESVSPIKRKSILGVSLILLSSFLVFAFLWAKKRFPVSEPEIIYFTITRPVAGGTNGLFSSIVLAVVLPTLAVTILTSLIFFLGTKHLKHRYEVKWQKFKIMGGGGGIKLR